MLPLMRRWLPLLMMIITAATLAGCGSHGAIPTNRSFTSSGPPESGLFSSRLTRVCREAEAALARAGPNQDKIALIDERYLSALPALTPASALRASYLEFLAVAKRVLAKVQSGQLTGAEEIFFRSRPLATKLGARACRMWSVDPRFL